MNMTPETLGLADIDAQMQALMRDAARRDGMKIGEWVAARMREAVERAGCNQPATLSSKGRGEDLEAAAEAAHRARWWPGDEAHITPFAAEDQRGQEYCRRIARAVLALGHPAPAPCSPVAREGESLLARVVAEIEAEIPMPGNDRQMHGTYAQGVFAALQIARQALAQTPPALSGGGELRFIAAIIEQSPNGETVSVKYHPDGEWTVYDRDAGPMLAALAQSTPAVGEGWRPVDDDVPMCERMLMCWADCTGLPPHVELGWRTSEGWCNTYGKMFSGLPTHWLPLPVVPHGGGL